MASASSSPYGVDKSLELVVELLTATTLVPEDRLTIAAARAREQGSLADALVEGGLSTREGKVRMLAARYQRGWVDLTTVTHTAEGVELPGIDESAARLFPLDALERLVVLPYKFGERDKLCVAVADPGDFHSIDALRLATHHSLEVFVADRDDILREIRLLERHTGRQSAGVEAAGLSCPHCGHLITRQSN